VCFGRLSPTAVDEKPKMPNTARVTINLFIAFTLDSTNLLSFDTANSRIYSEKSKEQWPRWFETIT
jgi:hypothetical protein